MPSESSGRRATVYPQVIKSSHNPGELPPTPDSGRVRTILLIDDEDSIRELVDACLSDLAGWNVITVASAQQGLKQLTVQHPDVILLDLLMPGMDAIVFLQRLHENPATELIPVILLTVKAPWFSQRKLQQLGIVEAIAKPFNPVTLSDTISHALQWDRPG